jgi:hypothetical protein
MRETSGPFKVFGGERLMVVTRDFTSYFYFRPLAEFITAAKVAIRRVLASVCLDAQGGWGMGFWMVGWFHAQSLSMVASAAL